jgi:predicted MFS family arabinose efflux permease
MPTTMPATMPATTPATTPTTVPAADAEPNRLGLAVGWLTLFLIGTDLFVVSPLLPLISRQYDVSAGAAGLMVTAFSVAYAVGAPFLGGLADRMGRRAVLIGGLLAFTIGNALTALAPTFAVLVVARLLTGLAAAGVTPSTYALVGAAAPGAKRGAWLALVGSGLLIALSVGAPIGSVVGDAVGWRPVFWVLAGVAVALAAVNRRSWPASAPASSRDVERVGVLEKARAVSVTALWGCAIYGFYTYLATGLRGQWDMGPGLFAAVLVCYGVGAVCGSLGGGRLSDRAGARRVATWSLAGIAVGEVVTALALPVGALVVATLALLALVGYASFPAHQARLVAAYASRSGSLLAWNNSALYVGISVGSVIGGALIGGPGFRWVLIAMAFVAVLAAADSGWWAMPRESSRPGAR